MEQMTDKAPICCSLVTFKVAKNLNVPFTVCLFDIDILELVVMET